MGTSQKTFDQVKSILGKLDRTIDDVRQRRLGDPVRPAVGVAPATVSGPVLSAGLNTTIPAGPVSSAIAPAAGLAKLPSPLAPPPPGPSKSGYGRAQPIRPEARSA